MSPHPYTTFEKIKYYAVEIAGLVVFLAWLASGVWHEVRHLLGF
jgi:hypothetical protein